jgi:hypothetical protein
VSWWHAFAAQTPTLLLPIVATTAAIWLGSRTWRTWRLHRRFAKDVEYGRVLIVRQGDHELVAEYLPFCGLLWSVGGEPAPWRRLPLAARTYRRR